MDVLVERILQDLRNTLKKDPLLDEFDILPVEESLSNKSPVLHIDHKVGLEKWCVKHVYIYSHTKFMAWRKGQESNEFVNPESLITWTCAVLLLNPVLETAWNSRKEMILQGNLLSCDELKFSELVLSHKPKCSPVYAHRQWVIQNCNAIVSLEHELTLCSRWADNYQSNYHAWDHRLWAIKNLGRNKPQVIEDELARTECWVAVHISDHCGLHYRQRLISALLEATPAVRREIDFCTELQKCYPGHEALWSHRRYLLWVSSNQPQRNSLCEKRSFNLVHNASSEREQVLCHVNDNQMHLKNITFGHYNFCSDNPDGNGHIHDEEYQLDCNGASSVIHPEIVQRTVNFKHETDTTDKNDSSKMEDTSNCNKIMPNVGELSPSFEEEVLKREVEFVQERQNAARHWPWEGLLLQRHVKWVSEVLGWKQILNR